jgi:RNA polymerase sigma factor (sigma-70 family)
MCAPDAALEQLYEAHAGELHGFARRRVGRQDAEDVVQEAYLHLLQTGLAATLEEPRAYLFRIAANLTVDATRKLATRTRYAEDEVVFLGFSAARTCPESEALLAVEMRRFHASLAELPPLCREAFLLNQIDGWTRAEIAEQLGLSVRTVDRHIVRAFAHARSRYQGQEQCPASQALARGVTMRKRNHAELLADPSGSASAPGTRVPRKAAA